MVGILQKLAKYVCMCKQKNGLTNKKAGGKKCSFGQPQHAVVYSLIGQK